MCQFCSEANEPMEPIGPNSEDHVGSSTSHAVIPEQGTIEQVDFSSCEVLLPHSTVSLKSINSFASNCSEYSVDANPNDGHFAEQGGFESGQDDPSNGLLNGHLSKSNSVISINDFEQSEYLRDSHKEGKNGFRLGKLDLRSTSFKTTYDDDDDISSSDEAFDEANEASPAYDNDEIWVPPDAANKDNNTDDSLATFDDDDDECTDSDGIEWAKPSSLNGCEDGVSVSYRFKEEKQKAMEEVMNGKFKNLVSQLLKKLGVENLDGHEGSWVDIVTCLAWQAALFIKPDATKAKAMDPAGYVKIKCIATGSPADSRLIKGLVFKKHAAHKHMATKYKNPRLLLIEGVLDQSSGSSGLSSFSSMISQDEDNLAVLVKNLEVCHPNVILVEKSASRDVVERVLKLGITLVLDMKLHRLERVAHCTGSPILTSNATFNHDLSHCDAVYFQKFVEDHATVGEGGKKPSKTLMFLEGCPKRLGCTILLKGSHCEELKKIKCVVQFAVVMAYNFILETSFLVDQKAMFSTFLYCAEAGISLTDEQLTSVLVKTPHAPYSGEPIGGNGVQVPIANGDDGGSSHVQECTANAALSHVFDIPISNGFEEGSILVKEKTAKATETATSDGFHDNVTDNMVVDDTSTGSNEPCMSTVLRSQPSISDALGKVSMVSPATFQQLSAYVDWNERQSDAETAASIPVSPSEEAPEGGSREVKGSSQDMPLPNDSQPSSTFFAVAEDSPKASEDATKSVDGEDSVHPMDEISCMLDAESILVLKSSRNASKGTICEQSHFSHIKFYRNFDLPLEKFLLENLFSQSDRCKECREPREAHFYYYAHHSKQLTIRVKQLGKEPPLPGKSEGRLWMWSRCGKCEPSQKVETKRVLISSAARGLSFGKFLELSLSSHSSFNRLSSCGHSFQKDFLYFFGLGSMVAMFQYSRVARYKVSLPAQKLVFSGSINTDWLQNEIESVYTKGLLLFTEIANYLKKIESEFSGSNLLNGSSEGFSDIVALLRLERSEFEENIKDISIKNENSHASVCKLPSLNQLRWEILLEARIWNKRLRLLQFLLASSYNGVAQRQMNLENRDAGGRAGGSHMAAGKAVQEQMVLEDQKVEGTEENVDKAIQEQKCLEKDHSEGTMAAADETVEGQTGVDDNSAVEVERMQSIATSCADNSMIEPVECVSRSENCCDGEVPIERVPGADKPSMKDFPIHGSGGQVLSLPIAEDIIQGSNPVDSAPAVSSLQESLGSPNLPSTLQSISESHQTNNTSLSVDVLEGRNIPLVVNKEDACCAESYAFERLASMTSPNSEDSTGWIWHPLSQVREKCIRDLRQETVADLLPTLSQVVNEEGSRLHIPVNDGGYIVSDYDGEISSCVACALAIIKDQSPSASDSDENISLKRAVSEPSPNLSLKSYDSDVFHSTPSMPWTGSRFPSFDGLNRLDSMADYGLIHPEVTLGIDKYSMKGKYSVVIMYADKFRALRERCCPSELDYIASLSRCKIWDAKGGKSKSFFAKTLDDRLIIKEIKKIEFESFMKFAPNYFSHMNQSFEFGNQTCLAKILGIYQVTIRHAKTGRETKHDLMVQENLSFGRSITRQYDLKGALHARFTATADGAGDVLLDQNFVNDMNSSPLYIGQRAKRLLQRAVWNDTTFLNSIRVMDYSLLVGVDRPRKELVCGIIDYLRQYTWDKQVEMVVKASLVVPKNMLPTVISPESYKKRFRKFMDTRFLTVPDHWCSQRSSNPCRLCGIKAADDSSLVKPSDKQEEELNGSSAHL